MSIELGLPAHRDALAGLPQATEPLTKKDFTPAGEVRWCPGCGDYAILAAVQGLLPTLGIKRENIVCVSGIGCSSRFPYYLDSYGMHSIHGRAPAIATGVAVAREDLSVLVVTGDGDALSIGGNHLIHALRRNVNITILLFNNQIYGLTKGQYSPTSEEGKVTKSTPLGSVDYPFNPMSVALGADASFAARTVDTDRKHMSAVIEAAMRHKGASFVEIYQNCPIFNDGAFTLIRGRDSAAQRIVHVEHGQPLTFGTDDVQRAIVSLGVEGYAVAAAAGADPVVHNAEAASPAHAFALTRLTDVTGECVPLGIFRQVSRETYDDGVRQQTQYTVEQSGGPATDADLQSLLHGTDTWTVS